jgi:hypothetical protein
MFRYRMLRILALVLSVFFVLGDPAKAGTADWVVQIMTKVVEPCLNYPNSKLSPLIRSSIYFEQNVLDPSDVDRELQKRGAEPDAAIPETLYEHLYYSHSRALGLRRYKQLVLKPGTTGTIRITTSSSSNQEEISAAVNATIRIYLDLYLNKMPLRSIVVPKDSFDLFIQGMQKHGFRNFTAVPGQFSPSLATLSIRSEPAGRQQYMNYGF